MTKNAGILTAHLEEKKTKSGIKYYIRYQDIDKKRYRVLGGDKKGRALTFLSQFEASLNSKEAVEARLNHGLTYRDFCSKVDSERTLDKLIKQPINEFLTERNVAAQYEKSANTKLAYQRCHNQFLDFIAHFNKKNGTKIYYMEDISLAVLEGFQMYLSSILKFSPASISQRMNIIRGHLNRAENLGIIPKSPSIHLKQIIIPEKEIIIYSDDELKRLFNVIQSKSKIWYIYAKIALDTGARPMELQELVKKKHISFYKEGNIEYGTILIESQLGRTTKSKNSRHVALSMETVLLLKPFLLSFKDDDVVFKDIDRSKGKKYSSFLTLAGISSTKSIYTLRRTCISKLARTVSPIQLMKIAGHRNINTTLRYYIALDSKDIARDLAIAAYKAMPKQSDADSVQELRRKYAV